MFSRSPHLFAGHALAVPHPVVAHIGTPAPGTGTRQRTLLDLMMPDYHFRGGAKVSVEATPEEVLRALEEVTLAEIPLASAIGAIRYLPGRILGKRRPVDALTRTFFEAAMPLRLGEDPGREIVIGGAGKFHNLIDRQFADLPDLFTFTRFNDADYQKLAIAFRAVPEPAGTRTMLISEHRTLALSPASRRTFALSWFLLVGWGGNFILRQLLKAVRRRVEADHRQAASAA